jgi:hypothetical protein
MLNKPPHISVVDGLCDLVYTVNPFEEAGITLPKLQAILPLQWRRCTLKVIEQTAAVDMLQYQEIPSILYK